MRHGRFGLLVCLLLTVFIAASVIGAQQRRTTKDGIYTSQQAQRGEKLYSERCTSCHGAALVGATAPPLGGKAFFEGWKAVTLADVYTKIQDTMPADAPGSMAKNESADLLAYLLSVTKYTTGESELSSDSAALKAITIELP